MRDKSENEARDRYSRLFASVLLAESLADYLSTGNTASVTVEAEDLQLWDDVLLETQSCTWRYQVKRQQTDLTRELIASLFNKIVPSNHVRHSLVLPVLVNVQECGELRVLRGICERIQQPGAVGERVLGNLRAAERNWIDALKENPTDSDESVLELITRFNIDIVGFEEDLASRGKRALARYWRTQTEAAWQQIVNRLREGDGVVAVDVKSLVNELPVRSAPPIDDLYQSFVEEVEDRLWLNKWETVSDLMVRGIVPREFYDDAHMLQKAYVTTAWPGRDLDFEQALGNLVRCLIDYVECFASRAEYQDRRLVEDLSYKRIYPNPNYHNEAQAARDWDRRCMQRLNNLVVALNEYAAAVRKNVDENYRMRNGLFAIHDSLGIRNREMNSNYWIPNEYMPLK